MCGKYTCLLMYQWQLPPTSFWPREAARSDVTDYYSLGGGVQRLDTKLDSDNHFCQEKNELSVRAWWWDKASLTVFRDQYVFRSKGTKQSRFSRLFLLSFQKQRSSIKAAPSATNIKLSHKIPITTAKYSLTAHENKQNHDAEVGVVPSVERPTSWITIPFKRPPPL